MSRIFRAMVLAVVLAVSTGVRAEDAAEMLGASNAAVLVELKKLNDADNLNPETTLGVIQDKISPLIDFRSVSARATGKYWRRAKDDEKADIIKSFRAILEKTYSKVLAKYTDQEIRVTDSKTRDDGKTAVMAEVSGGGKTATLEYVFSEENKIIDIKVEGLSLIDNYRRQFSGIAKKNGIPGLAEKLREIAAR